MSETFYKFSGFWWSCKDFISEPNPPNIRGPYCLGCYSEIDFPEDTSEDIPDGVDYDVLDEMWTGEITCGLCSRKYQLTETIYNLKYKVSLILKSNYRAQLTKVSLDEPIATVRVRDQDSKYFIAARIGQKDGKRVGVVYFGEKVKTQKKTDYSQIFIDLDDEQLRFDKSNKHPREILAKFTAEFASTTHTADFKGKTKKQQSVKL